MKKLIGSLIAMTLLSAAYLAGCSSPTPTSPASTATPTKTGTPTVMLTPTKTSTQTPTGTLTPSATPTATATAQAAQAAPAIGTAANYLILANTAFTNTGATTACGGLVGDTVGGSGYNNSPAGTPGGTYIQCANVNIVPDFSSAAMNTADISVNNAYTNNTVSARPGGAPIPADLGGYTLYPGLYTAGSTLGITGILTLDGLSQTNPVFILQVPAAFTIVGGAPSTPAGTVNLINGAKAANVYWIVGGACTLGTYSVFAGNILAYAGVVMNTQATLNGRAFGINAATTFDSNNIFMP